MFARDSQVRQFLDALLSYQGRNSGFKCSSEIESITDLEIGDGRDDVPLLLRYQNVTIGGGAVQSSSSAWFGSLRQAWLTVTDVTQRDTTTGLDSDWK
jgi:hypothetical protein